MKQHQTILYADDLNKNIEFRGCMMNLEGLVRIQLGVVDLFSVLDRI